VPHASVAASASVGFSCRELRTHAEFIEASALYSRVFAYSENEFALNANLLTSLARNGGSAVGAYSSEGDLIGFAYGFAGSDGHGATYHFSQAAAVDPDHQGRGVGKALKLAQRDVALGWGQRTMRWTFDPILSRNAHFNLSSLGAVGIAFVPDYYARPGTDRLVVAWDLTDTSATAATDAVIESPPPVERADWGRSLPAADGGSWIVTSARPDDLSAAERTTLASKLGQTLTEVFLRGEVLISASRIDETTAVYRAVPGEGAA
jgi:predicted GNAT superfamily acetyltransferase